MTDQPEAFSGIDREINPSECANGAEILFDAGQLDDTHFFTLAAIAFSASSWVYS
jgi:hypothetical protein